MKANLTPFQSNPGDPTATGELERERERDTRHLLKQTPMTNISPDTPENAKKSNTAY